MTSPLAALRITILPMMLFPFFLLIALWFVVTDDRFATMEGTSLYVMLAALVVSVLGLLLFGYRAAPSPDGLSPSEAAQRGVGQFRTLTFVRQALAEIPLFAGLVMTFLDGHGMMPFLTGLVAALVLMGWHVLPNDSQISKVQARLESRGARVPLREAMHGQPVH